MLTRRRTEAAAVLLGLFLVGSAGGSSAGATFERRDDGIEVGVRGAWLRLQVCSAGIVRVAYAPERAFFDRGSLATSVKRCEKIPWLTKSDGTSVSLVTGDLTVKVNLLAGTLAFADASGRPLLSERSGGRTLEAAEVQGEKTFHVGQAWEANPDESLYGLGQHQLGLVDIKGYDLDLWQHNGTVIVPFLVSSRGWGILWDNTSFTRFGDLAPAQPIPGRLMIDPDGVRGGLRASYFAGFQFDRKVSSRVDSKIDIAVASGAKEANLLIDRALPAEGPVSVRWEGEIEPEASGDHLFDTFSNNGIRLYVDGKVVIDHWRQGWLPWHDVARLYLEAKRRYPVKLEWYKDQGMETVKLLWKTPPLAPATSLWSEVGDGVDYYFVRGKELDDVIAGYRRLTGEAPVPPLWAFGLWQSRQRYKTQQESLDVLQGFRRRHIPFDNIVQDWFYWKEDEWGSHAFDNERFPDPEGWIRAIHRDHAHLMISVWPKFYPGTANFRALHDKGYLYEPNLAEGIKDWLGHPDTFYDAFNSGARKLFWTQIEEALFSKGVDAWWMDASEPDLTPTPTLEGQKTHVTPTAMGSGSRMLNAYSLVNSEAVYEGQRGADKEKRVFILTRSGFAGQQRYAAATWSGDISSTWAALRKQIAAGLGYSVSGLPYWTMDIGGFSVPARFSQEHPSEEDADEWRELNARWFEFGVFTPLLRVHGEFPYREMWELGGESHPAYRAELKFDRLRYRLLPYIYSLAGAVTQTHGTIMRPLVMDFRDDTRCRATADEYMFGPAFLVNPVTTYKARSREVYLPAGSLWYDFWTGEARGEARTLEAPAPYDQMPLYVRAGSIVPFGQEIEYTAQVQGAPLTLVVYSGADGEFPLYEDDGETYAYETGGFATVPLRWNDKTRTLTVGGRSGAFAGMTKERDLNVILVSKSHPSGFPFDAAKGRSIRYRGEEVSLRFEE